MDELAAELEGTAVDLQTLEREFERTLPDSATLAFRVAYSVLRHREDAEDVAQEALLRAHARLSTLRHPERLQAWLVRVTWRLSMDFRRSSRRRERRQHSWSNPDPPPNAEEIASRSQREDRLWQALDRLPEKLRVVTVLATIEGHDLGAVARSLGLPEGTVKSRLHAARKRLAEELRWTV